MYKESERKEARLCRNQALTSLKFPLARTTYSHILALIYKKKLTIILLKHKLHFKWHLKVPSSFAFKFTITWMLSFCFLVGSSTKKNRSYSFSSQQQNVRKTLQNCSMWHTTISRWGIFLWTFIYLFCYFVRASIILFRGKLGTLNWTIRTNGMNHKKCRMKLQFSPTPLDCYRLNFNIKFVCSK